MLKGLNGAISCTICHYVSLIPTPIQPEPLPPQPPVPGKADTNGATANKTEPVKDEAQAQDLFAYLSSKYEVPKNTISSDFTSASSETRAGSKVCSSFHFTLDIDDGSLHTQFSFSY